MQFFLISSSLIGSIVDKTISKRFNSFSGRKIIALHQSGWFGNSKVSANRIGIAPTASDSQKRIEFGIN